ncbi:TPA: hypothetical protein ACOENG_001054 [Stenotrophomonas maltophilia]|uniref:hypothetical protein n=1 Tax=Pseudomonadota TaxID=1224 RepID=UPI000FDB1500|nr:MULTISPECIES: hypothetical protein [Pseudomonadota]EGT0505463.1 hypothetical protein [Serratia marcescens]MBH1412955.1 hypothetical protein [Stenotrophomonas maltophilia]MBH1620846.1 hypothetical protein [Stenotrophomonas maltophilia]MBN5111743.1 hypothetical protein [Stenotrophomonas maltophilia]MCF5089756.1 hypothetical protein [Stenotrophomonas sp. PA-6-5C]
MENAARRRAADVRIGVGSVPVKDRYRQQGDAESMVSCRDKANKNAAGMSALRRVKKEKQDMRQAANGQNFGGVSDGV